MFSEFYFQHGKYNTITCLLLQENIYFDMGRHG